MTQSQDSTDTPEVCPVCHGTGNRHIWNGAAFAVFDRFTCPKCNIDTLTYKQRGKTQ